MLQVQVGDNGPTFNKIMSLFYYEFAKVGRQPAADILVPSHSLE